MPLKFYEMCLEGCGASLGSSSISVYLSEILEMPSVNTMESSMLASTLDISKGELCGMVAVSGLVAQNANLVGKMHFEPKLKLNETSVSIKVFRCS